MASKGFYPVSTLNPDHEIKKANSKRACWGAEVNVGEFWLPVNAPFCSGSILPGDYYLVHDDRRDHLHRVNSCLQCAIHFNLSELEGDLVRYIPATKEQLDATKAALKQQLEELRQM